jgi:hypothetical protein
MFRKRKAQINLEFLASAGFYILALGTVLTVGADILPQYSQEADKASLNLEARSLTNQLVTEKGTHNYNAGGTDWESSADTISNTTSIGLASDFLELERDKIEALSTVSQTGQDMNYSHFKEVTGAKNQYRFKFIWMPTVHTKDYFIRTNPPSNPDITEPDNPSYNSADNRIHYGEITLEARSYKFLVTAHDDVYDRFYISSDWDFQNDVPRQKNQEISGTPFEVQSFQNRERKPGSLLVLNQTINTFGASIDADSIVTTFQRFGVMEGEPLKIKVWVW